MRVTSGVSRKKAHKKIFKFVKGFSNRRKNCYRIATQARDTARLDSYIGRKLLKRDNKSLHIIRINAFCRSQGTTYSKFMYNLSSKGYNLTRKAIGELCVHSKESAISLLKQVSS